MKLGLANITTLLAALGDPQRKYLKIQVAGTNGKGSVCAFLDAMCTAADYRTGRYTSPHLVSITERVMIGGVEATEDDLAAWATRVRKTAEKLVEEGGLESLPTFFEQITAVGLLGFAESNVQIGILETGLGGRFDAVTAAGADIAALTRIDLDHQEYLGETIEQIAAEKAAVIRTDSKVVIGPQSPSAMTVINERLEALDVEPVGAAYAPWTVSPGPGEGVTVETTRNIFHDVRLGLAGKHQIENAQIALQVVQLLRYDLDLEISDRHIVEGLENARHPGRLEWIGDVLLDGAHNPAGAEALAAYLAESPRSPAVMIFGAMSGKDVRQIAAKLWPGVERLILTRPTNSRAISPSDLREFAPPGFDLDRIILADTPESAIEKARAEADGGAIVVTGSLYLVGDVRRILAGEAGR